MVFMILAGGAYLALMAMLIPSMRLQQALLALMGRGVRVLLMVLVSVAAVFHFRPDLVPADAVAFIQNLPLTGLGLVDSQGVRWLPLSAVMVIAAVPLLAILDFARRLASHARLMHRWEGRIAQVVRSVAGASESATVGGRRRGDPARAFERQAVATQVKPLADYLD